MRLGTCKIDLSPPVMFTDRSKAILLWWFFVLCLGVLNFLCCWCLMYVFIFSVKVTHWPPIGKIAAHSAYDMFSWYKYLIVNLFFFQSPFLEWESFSDCAFS